MTVVATIPKRIGRAMSPGKAPINTGPVVANSSHRDVIRALQHSRGVRGLNPKVTLTSHGDPNTWLSG